MPDEAPLAWRERLAVVEARELLLEQSVDRRIEELRTDLQDELILDRETVDRRIRHLREDVQRLFDLDREREDEERAAHRFVVQTLIAAGALVVTAAGVTAALVSQF